MLPFNPEIVISVVILDEKTKFTSQWFLVFSLSLKKIARTNQQYVPNNKIKHKAARYILLSTFEWQRKCIDW